MTQPARCRDGRCVRMNPGLCGPCSGRLAGWLSDLPGFVATIADEHDAATPCCDDHAPPPPPGGALGALADVYEPTHPNPAPAGAVRAAGTGPRVSGSGERPLPGGVDRLSWLACAATVSYWAGSDDWEYQTGRPPLAASLASWVRQAAEALGVTVPRAGRVIAGRGGQLVRRTSGSDVPTLVAFLTIQHPRIVELPWSDDYAAEVHTAWSTARAMAGEAERWVRIGACIAVLDDGQACGETLATRPDARVIRCPGCGADWGRELWLLLGAAIDNMAEEMTA